MIYKVIVFSLLFYCLLFRQTNCGGQIITTIAGASPPGWTGDFAGDNGPATAALLNTPSSMAFDVLGNIYIADEGNAHIRKIDSNGIISSIAGTNFYGYGGDDSIATVAKFCDMGFIKLKSDGTLYIPDICNNRIRKIDLSSDIITTDVGNGFAYCFSGDGFATSTSLVGPFSVELDVLGRIYFSTVCNYVFRVEMDNHLTIIAGSDSAGNYSGDNGPATDATINHPTDIALDKFGNLYISDMHNNVIRKVDVSGVITTFAGIFNTYGYSGDNGVATLAKLNSPTGITTDGEGNVFFADCVNNVVRRIDYYTNIITTVVGCGAGWNVDTGGFSGDGGPATAAKLYHPAGITFDKDGNLYIADWLNNRVRKVTNVGVPLGVVNRMESSDNPFKLYPNPALNEINVRTDAPGEVQIFDLTGRLVQDVDVIQFSVTIRVDELPSGVYVTVFTDTRNNKSYGKFLKE